MMQYVYPDGSGLLPDVGNYTMQGESPLSFGSVIKSPQTYWNNLIAPKQSPICLNYCKRTNQIKEKTVYLD